MLNPIVVDLSHHNDVQDLGLAYEFGIRGVIHKATEGFTYVDAAYRARRISAGEAGLMWGAYHFFKPGPVEPQVGHFLKHAAPDENTLLVLDHENVGCSVAGVREFCQLIEKRVGRKCAIYSGHLIKDQLGGKVDDYLGSHRLWLAQYGDRAVVQPSWKTYWLWQYTGDGRGMEPHNVPGLRTKTMKGIDINSFVGSEDKLRQEWSGSEAAVPVAIDVPTGKAKKTVLLPGSTHADVQLLKDGLCEMIQREPGYGFLTEQTLRAVQAQRGIRVDGVVGNNETWPIILAEIEKGPDA